MIQHDTTNIWKKRIAPTINRLKRPWRCWEVLILGGFCSHVFWPGWAGFKLVWIGGLDSTKMIKMNNPMTCLKWRDRKFLFTNGSFTKCTRKFEQMFFFSKEKLVFTRIFLGARPPGWHGWHVFSVWGHPRSFAQLRLLSNAIKPRKKHR